MMFLKRFHVILDILVLVPGVCSGQWGETAISNGQWRVTITNPPPCVIRGSTVDISCSYEYPKGLTVIDTIWYKKTTWPLKDKRVLSEPRFQYIGNKLHDCSLRINNIQDSDMGSYYFRFETDSGGYNSLSISLSGLTSLTAQVTPHTVSERGVVTLYCETSCKPRPTTVWFKDGQRVADPRFQAKIQDAGSYQCAVEGQETWKSDAVMLDVQYGPQNVVLSVNPPDVVKGSSVTLTCSSRASNPPIQRYILLKDNIVVVARKKTVTISNIQPRSSGEYSCQAENNITTVTSPPLTMNVLYGPQNVVLSVNPPGDVVEGSSVTLSCSSRASNPPIQRYILLKDNTEVTQNKTVTISNIQPSDSGIYSCQAENNITTVTSPPVTMNVLYGPQNVVMSANPPGEVVEGSTVTLTCSSVANPPVDTYTWYRDGGSTVISTGPQLVKDKVSPADSGQYTCQGTNTHGSQMSTPQSIEVLSSKEPASSTLPPYLYAVISVGVSVFMLVLGLCLGKKCRDPCCVRPVQLQGTNQGSAGRQPTNQSGSSDDTYCPLQHGDRSVYGVLNGPRPIPNDSSRPQRPAVAVYANVSGHQRVNIQ